MKKIYLSIFALVVGVTGVNAQLEQEKVSTLSQYPGDLPAVHSKALGQTIWSDNFDDASLWNIDNDGQNAASYGWSIDATGDGWWAANGISSTSGGNYAELSNSDGSSSGSSVVGVTYTMTTADSIDISNLSGGSNEAILTFEQFGARFNDIQEVQISTDGTTFTTIHDNLDREVLTGDGGSPYDNPETITIPITAAIAANPSKVWLRFKWTSNFPGNTTAGAWITYGWFIDDIKISTLPDHDIAYTNTYWGTAGLQYYAIPVEQVSPIDFSVNVLNQGSQNQTNVKFNVDANGTILSSAVANIAVNGTDSLFTSYTPTEGTLNISTALNADSTDDIASNNAFPSISPITIGGVVYSRDNGDVFSGTGGGSNNDVFGYEAGNYFDMYTTKECGVVDVGIANTASNVGTEIYAAIYSVTATDFILEGVSDFYEVQSSDLGKIKSIIIEDVVTLNAGSTYMAVVGTTEDFRYATSGTTAPSTSLIYYPTMASPNTGANFYTTATPVVRLNFTPLGLDEVNIETTVSQNVPNPFSVNTKITFDVKDAQKVSLTVTDLSGKVVKSMNLGVMNPGVQSVTLNGADFAEGIYTYTLTVGNNSSTKKMIVKK